MLGVRLSTYLFKGHNSTHDRFRGVRRSPEAGSESHSVTSASDPGEQQDSCMHGIVLNTQTDQLFQTAEEEAKGHRGKLGPSPKLPCSHAAEWHCVVVGSSLQTPGSAGLGQPSFLYLVHLQLLPSPSVPGGGTNLYTLVQQILGLRQIVCEVGRPVASKEPPSAYTTSFMFKGF